jgi:hypothetical protein
MLSAPIEDDDRLPLLLHRRPGIVASATPSNAHRDSRSPISSIEQLPSLCSILSTLVGERSSTDTNVTTHWLQHGKFEDNA